MKANLPNREPEIQGWWEESGAYNRILESRRGCEPYVLHDGPPYANGHIHLGQALNKILKDMVVKSRSMMNREARYVPGWDCHGLPIEHRVDKEIGPRKKGMTALEIRERCRKYAEKFIKIQSDEFLRLGVLWDRQLDRSEREIDAPSRRAIYRTLDRTYEAEIIRQIGRFFTRGAVYYGEKPVHWCSSCKTALAEAEVEYMDRTDSSVFVKFPVTGLGARIPALENRNVSVTIWTTTPWTLPANLAVSLHPDLPYVAVEIGSDVHIVAEGLLLQVAASLDWGVPPVLARFTGRELVGEGDDWVGASAPVQRPYNMEKGPASGPGLLLLGEHVTLEAGTGNVHTAPGHGAEDFHIGQHYNLPPFNPVGDDGRFIGDRVGPEWLKGVYVLDANALIIEDLKDRDLLLHHEEIAHSYPHCWRCKNPVLFRSTPQWFISVDATGLREASLKGIHESAWLPEFGQARIAGMVETRPDWCISRQRTWGVPLPTVLCDRCMPEHPDAFIRDKALFDHIERLFLDEGSNAWFGVPDGGSGRHHPYASHEERLDRLVPAELTCEHCGKRDRLRFDEHIVDVWFESGVSHSAVLGRDDAMPWPSDLYLEGHDQYRGWFQSSLLVAVNDRDLPPYRQVVTHGFTLDGEGRKMSKSLGNVISPMDVARERGADILRLWVSMIDFFEDMRLSQESLDRNSEAYRKIRNTFRYLLGNLHRFDPSTDMLEYDDLEEIDRWALQQFEGLRTRLVKAYDGFQFHTVYHSLYNFCSVTLSSFYLDILKDRLYTFPPRSKSRRSAQTVMYQLAMGLCKLMAPVLCYTAEEIWQYLEEINGRETWAGSTVHAEIFPERLDIPQDGSLTERWDRLMEIRDEISRALEDARVAKRIGTSLEARVRIEGSREIIDALGAFGDSLRFLLITSGVEFAPVGDGAYRSEKYPGLAVEVLAAEGDKCARCWNYTTDVGSDPEFATVCARCAGHVREIITGSESE